MTRRPRMIRLATLCLFLSLTGATLPGAAREPAAAGSPPLDAAARAKLVEEIAAALETMYVDPEEGRRLAGQIRTRARDRAYDGLRTAPEFASRLTRELQEIGKDKHLAVLEESQHGATVARIVERRGGEPSGRAPERRVVRHAAGLGGPEAERWRRANHGVQRAERLEGNVGYLRITGFPAGEGARTALAGAMGVLAGTDSLIVDLRECPGGMPDTVNFLSSYFFGPEPIELISRYNRRADETEKDFTLRELPGARRAETDLRILTSASTGSACESFAYILQQHGRARVIGERTAGAGHLAARFPIGSGLVLAVSVKRPVHPRTGRGWEGTGVQPDIAAPAASALSVAHREALDRLAASAGDEMTKRRLAWAAEAVRARNEPAPPAKELRGHAGKYGEREVTLDPDGLYYRGPGSRRSGPLLFLSADVFAIDEEARLRFERNAAGDVAAMTLLRVDGSAERITREPAAARSGSPREELPATSPAPAPAPAPARRTHPGAGAAGVESASLPDTPAGHRAAAFFEAARSGEPEKARRIIAANWAEIALAEAPAGERAARLAGIARDHPGLSPRRVLSADTSRVVVLAEDARGGWLEVRVRVEPAAPHKIVGVALERSTPDAQAPEAPKGSDEEAGRAVEEYLRGLSAADEFSGVVLLARNGVPFLSKAYGLADRERRIPNTLDTRFNIGSITKTITQIAIAQLAQRGKLSLSDTVRKHLPDYPSANADRITVQQLVTMSSGLGDIFGTRYAAADKARLTKLSDYMQFFADQPLLFEPGQGRRYSNAGYVVLGLIIERLTGRDYHDAVRQTVFGPAGMAQTGPLDPRRDSGFAVGYTRKLRDGDGGGEKVPNTAILPARASSAGGTYATAADLLRLDAALRRDVLLSPEYGDWLFSEKAAAPGGGGRRSGAFGVAGGVPGCNATLEIDLDGGLTMVVLANEDPPAAERVGRKIREWLGQ